MKKLKLRLVSVLMLCLIVIFLLPLWGTFVNSLTTSEGLIENYPMLAPGEQIQLSKGLMLIPNHFTIKQYYNLLVDNNRFLMMFWNSVFLVLPIVLGQIIVASMAAFVFAKGNFKGRDVLFIIYVLTMLMPFIVTLVPNFLVIDAMGLMNNRLAIILPGIFTSFGVFLLRQYMITIPNELIEAAKMDGANQFEIFLYVVMPMTKNGLVALFILAFIDHWNMVEQPIVFLADSSSHPLSVLLGQLNNQYFEIAFAAGIFYLLPILIMYYLTEKQLIEGISHTAMK